MSQAQASTERLRALFARSMAGMGGLCLLLRQRGRHEEADEATRLRDEFGRWAARMIVRIDGEESPVVSLDDARRRAAGGEL